MKLLLSKEEITKAVVHWVYEMKGLDIEDVEFVLNTDIIDSLDIIEIQADFA